MEQLHLYSSNSPDSSLIPFYLGTLVACMYVYIYIYVCIHIYLIHILAIMVEKANSLVFLTYSSLQVPHQVKAV